MNSTERVTNTILGKETDRQPIYGWLYGNLTTEIDNEFGSIHQLEMDYQFDAVHLFSAPYPFNDKLIDEVKWNGEEFTPDKLLKLDFLLPYDDDRAYDAIRADVAYHKANGERFTYVQTQGFLEPFNGIFGIQNSLMYLALYPDEMMELYERMAAWNLEYIPRVAACGVDMIHFSDDWGSQNSLLISPKMWKNMIYPNMKKCVEKVHDVGKFASLHSDGCIRSVLDGVADIGFDLIHPWQENADMPYDLYLDKYKDKFAIMGGINVQNALGIMERDDLERDIRRIFKLLRGKRWVVCTSHFVQKHCKIEDLRFALDLIYELAREEV